MAGIPSAGGVRGAPRAVIRLLLKGALVTGMVVVGWLLGSATGLAQENWPPQAQTPQAQTPQAQAPRGIGLADLADTPPPDLIPTVTLADVHV
ncbi:MAG: hypothetical protein ABR608_01030, partial [Pseudonocardiaceae bacterium]